MVECRDLSQHNPGQPLREESPYCVLVKKETATPVSSRPEKSERAVAGSGRSVDNDRMLSLTGVRGRKEGRREKGTKSNGPFYIERERERELSASKIEWRKERKMAKQTNKRRKEPFLPEKIN